MRNLQAGWNCRKMYLEFPVVREKQQKKAAVAAEIHPPMKNAAVIATVQRMRIRTVAVMTVRNPVALQMSAVQILRNQKGAAVVKAVAD
mgnify:CR=1 FL=1